MATFSVIVRRNGSTCLLIHFADGVDHGLRLVELDVFRAVRAKICFEFEDCVSQRAWARVISCSYLRCFGVSGGFVFQVADAVVAAGEDANGPRANEWPMLLQDRFRLASSAPSPKHKRHTCATLVCAISNSLAFNSCDHSFSGKPRKNC